MVGQLFSGVGVASALDGPKANALTTRRGAMTPPGRVVTTTRSNNITITFLFKVDLNLTGTRAQSTILRHNWDRQLSQSNR